MSSKGRSSTRSKIFSRMSTSARVDAFLAADLRALVAEEQVVERVEGVGGARVVRVENVLILWFGL